jgi:hypothetical protein
MNRYPICAAKNVSVIDSARHPSPPCSRAHAARRSSGRVLPAHGPCRIDRLHRPNDLDLSSRMDSGDMFAGGSMVRRLSICSNVVLNDVAHDSRFFEVGALFSMPIDSRRSVARGRRRRGSTPPRRPNCRSGRRGCSDRFLAQVVVDSEDLRLVEDLVDDAVEFWQMPGQPNGFSTTTRVPCARSASCKPLMVSGIADGGIAK